MTDFPPPPPLCGGLMLVSLITGIPSQGMSEVLIAYVHTTTRYAYPYEHTIYCLYS